MRFTQRSAAQKADVEPSQTAGRRKERPVRARLRRTEGVMKSASSNRRPSVIDPDSVTPVQSV